MSYGGGSKKDAKKFGELQETSYLWGVLFLINLKTKTMKNYTVRVTADYPHNQGDPELLAQYSINDYAAAESCFAEQLQNVDNMQCYGYNVTVMLIDNTGDEPKILKEEECVSSDIPEDAIIVTYQHNTYRNYCYDIVAIRHPERGERYCDLIPDTGGIAPLFFAPNKKTA